MSSKKIRLVQSTVRKMVSALLAFTLITASITLGIAPIEQANLVGSAKALNPEAEWTTPITSRATDIDYNPSSNTVYVAFKNGSAGAFDGRNGSVKWITTLRNKQNLNTLEYSSGSIFIGSNGRPGSFYKISKDGEIKVNKTFQDGSILDIEISKSGTPFIAYEGGVAKLDRNGVIQWKNGTKSNYANNVELRESNSSVILTTTQGGTNGIEKRNMGNGNLTYFQPYKYGTGAKPTHGLLYNPDKNSYIVSVDDTQQDTIEYHVSGNQIRSNRGTALSLHDLWTKNSKILTSGYHGAVHSTNLTGAWLEKDNTGPKILSSSGEEYKFFAADGSNQLARYGTGIATSATVSGTVTRPYGKPVSNASVSFYNVDGHRDMKTVRTGPNGTYNASIDKDVNVRITALKEHYTMDTTYRYVKIGENHTADFTIKPRRVGGFVKACPVYNPKCSNMTGVPDGTVVEAYGINFNGNYPDNISLPETRDKLSEIEKDIMNFDAEQIGWKPDLSLTGSGGKFAETDAKYVAVHKKEDWGLQEWSSGANLGSPVLTAPAGETFVMSVWDPTKNGFIQDGVDSDLPGATSNGTIVIKQLDYEGATVNTYRIQTDEVRSSLSPTASDHRYAEVTLPRGFYSVSVEGSELSYVMTVGDPDTIIQGIYDGLRNERDELTTRGEEIIDLKQNKTIKEYTTTTFTETTVNGRKKKGKFVFNNFSRGVSNVYVQAYSPSAKNITDPENATLSDLVELQSSGYNGSFYVTTEPDHIEVNRFDEDHTDTEIVRVVEVGSPPFANPSEFMNKSEWLETLLGNSTYADSVKDMLNTTTENASQIRDRLENIKNENEQLQERYQELLNQYEGNTETDPEAREQIRLLRQAIRELKGELQPEDPTSEFEQGTTSATIPWTGDLDPDAVSVTAHFPNSGNSKPVPDEYFSVNKRVGQGDVLKISEFPVPNGTKMVTFSTTVNGEDGEQVGSGDVSVADPSFDGSLLDLESVSVSTLRPGPNEQISISPTTVKDSAQIERINATVRGPNGAVDTSHGETDEEVQFTTNGKGSYAVTLDIMDVTGNTWTEAFTLKAHSQNLNQPPSVRVKDGFTGTYAMVGDGLSSGSVSQAGGLIKASAVAPTDNVPGEVHFYTETVSGSYQSSEVRVLKDSGGTAESVRKHIKVFVHTTNISKDAVIYRNGNPIPARGGSTYGSVTCGNESGCTIKSYTTGDGSATFTVVDNPNIIQSTMHWINLKSPIDLPLTVVPPMDGLLSAVNGMQFPDSIPTPNPLPVELSTPVVDPATVTAPFESLA